MQYASALSLALYFFFWNGSGWSQLQTCEDEDAKKKN